ncbi:heme-degrading domain-containing protein [Taklimakanibacter lacteus]|uniref:heme-degrading domain-containing protein n=1 Tax=Taklimakanibacter lacteus TaxID=2268456 RepID=UPI000E671A99
MAINEDIEKIVVQEQRLRFKRFDEDTAWQIGTRLRELGEARKLPIVIDIRLAGRQLFYCAFAGSTPDNPDWVRRKSNVVLRYLKSSYRVGRELSAKNDTLDTHRGVSPMDFAPHGGSFPIHVEGAGIIGAITVSGLPQREDHNLVVEALAGVLDQPLEGLALGPE